MISKAVFYSSMAEELYFMVINGKPEGPFGIAELKVRGLRPEDFVKTAAMDDYKEAHEVAELRQILGFKKPPVIPQYFGSFDQRLLASVIDWLIITGICVIPVLIVVMVTEAKLFQILLSASLLLVIPLLYMIYHVIMEGGKRQATIGKQILKIKVTNLQGDPINYAKAAVRNFDKLFSVLTLGIGYLMCFFNKKQQCLHDRLAGTLVVKDRLV